MQQCDDACEMLAKIKSRKSVAVVFFLSLSLLVTAGGGFLFVATHVNARIPIQVIPDGDRGKVREDLIGMACRGILHVCQSIRLPAASGGVSFFLALSSL